jgi:hypothetical protein
MSNVTVNFVFDEEETLLENYNQEITFTYACKVIFYTTGKVVIHSSSPKNIVNKTMYMIKNILETHKDFLFYKNIKSYTDTTAINNEINIFDIM